MLKDNVSLNKVDNEDTNVFQKSLIDRYHHRPQELISMCLAEFAATYVVNYGRRGQKMCISLVLCQMELLNFGW